MNNADKIKQLVEKLNKASNEYYNGLKTSLTDAEWDCGFNELSKLEKETDIILSNSPTQRAGYEIVDGLSKIKHSTPLLSLGKTKDVNDLLKFLGDREGVLMFKLDGGTQVINYNNGNLSYLATRGSSSTNEGQDITHNSTAIMGIPKTVNQEHIQVVGEGIMLKSKFEEINSKISDEDKYANARNLANASSSMFDSNRVADRDIRFVAFGALENDMFTTKIDELEYLNKNGFDVVEHVFVTKDNLIQEVERMTEKAKSLDYLVDGLVIAHNDIEYGKSLGKTSHHFNHSFAFKFFDESVTTTLRDILIDIGKSGQVSYTALFDPVEIDGTTVEKASVHNYEYIQDLQLGIGDSIETVKANMIIPQIIENNTRSGGYQKVLFCPICGSELEHKGVHQFCVNYDCKRQVVGRLVHWCSRDAMDIEGMSEETIKSIIDNIYMNSPLDLYFLHTVKDELLQIDRFGERKVEKLLEAIEKSKSKPLNNVLYGLAIPQLGRKASKIMAEHFLNMDKIMTDGYTKEELQAIIGNSVGESVWNNLITNKNMLEMTSGLFKSGVLMTQTIEEKSDALEGLTFVVTGKVEKFSNRKELQAHIESLGGKVSGGVSKNTNFLINNDINSTTGKNKKAIELGVKIINEETLLELIEENS